MRFAVNDAAWVRLAFAAACLLVLADARADILYVSGFNAARIEKITTSGGFSVLANTSVGGEGIAFDSAGNLYQANHYNNNIVKFTPSGSATVFASVGLNNPIA